MSNSVFDNASNDQNGKQDGQNQDDQTTLFHVGEGKKYGTLDELDKAYGHLNEHAGKLEEENKQLREKLGSEGDKEDAVQKILEALKPKDAPADQQDNKSDDGVNVEEVVRNILSQDKQQTQAERNTSQVREELTARYGDKAAEVYEQKAKELGIDLDDLSAKSPKAVLEFFPKAGGATNQAPRSGTNTYNLHSNEQEDPNRELFKAGKITREELYRRQWKDFLSRN